MREDILHWIWVSRVFLYNNSVLWLSHILINSILYIYKPKFQSTFFFLPFFFPFPLLPFVLVCSFSFSSLSTSSSLNSFPYLTLELLTLCYLISSFMCLIKFFCRMLDLWSYTISSFLVILNSSIFYPFLFTSGERDF